MNKDTKSDRIKKLLLLTSSKLKDRILFTKKLDDAKKYASNLDDNKLE